MTTHRASFPLLLLLSLLAASAAHADPRVTEPWPGVKVISEERQDPPLRLHAVLIDLEQSGAEVEVAPGGEDPDGDGPWQTVLQRAPAIAEKEGFDVTLNGDFFAVEKKPYRPGVSAKVNGPAVSDGLAWARAGSPRPSLLVDRGGRVSIARAQEPAAEVEEAIAGNEMLVEGGRDVARREGAFATTRHPRTAVGLADRGRTLVLLVVDGRRRGVSVGASLPELAAEMLRLGCEQAFNLDGGGSTTLVVRDPRTGALEVVNQPSDGKPRAIANVLGVSFKGRAD